MSDIILGTRTLEGRDAISPLFAHLRPDLGVTIDASQLRVLRLVGSPGEGKTRALRDYFEQLVALGWGGILLDPKGELAELAIRCTRFPERTICISPGMTPRRWSLNPLEIDPRHPHHEEIKAIVLGNTVATFAHIGRFDAQTMTNIRTYLNASVLLAQSRPQPTLIDALLILTRKDFRDRLLDREGDDYQRLFWANYEDLTEYMRQNQTISTLNRLWEMTQQAVVRGWIAPYHSTIRLLEWLNAGKIIIVNLGKRLHRSEGQYLGNLLMATIINGYRRRADGLLQDDTGRPWVVCADEFHTLAPAPFDEIITQGRSASVIPLIAHQDDSQLRAIEEIANAVSHAVVDLSLYRSKEDLISLERSEQNREKVAAIRKLRRFQGHLTMRTDAGTEELVIDLPADSAIPSDGQLAMGLWQQEDPAFTRDPADVPTLDAWLDGLPLVMQPPPRKSRPPAQTTPSGTKENDGPATTTPQTAAQTATQGAETDRSTTATGQATGGRAAGDRGAVSPGYLRRANGGTIVPPPVLRPGEQTSPPPRTRGRKPRGE